MQCNTGDQRMFTHMLSIQEQVLLIVVKLVQNVLQH